MSNLFVALGGGVWTMIVLFMGIAVGQGVSKKDRTDGK